MAVASFRGVVGSDADSCRDAQSIGSLGTRTTFAGKIRLCRRMSVDIVREFGEARHGSGSRVSEVGSRQRAVRNPPLQIGFNHFVISPIGYASKTKRGFRTAVQRLIFLYALLELVKHIDLVEHAMGAFITKTKSCLIHVKYRDGA